jgi:hypothetical protein
MELIKPMKGQFALIEILLIGLLLSSLIYLSYNSHREELQSYNYLVDSSIDAIYYSENFRDLIVSENLSVGILTQDWTEMQNILDYKFNNYELVIFNNTYEKVIFNGCDYDYKNKIIKERIVVLKNASSYDFRIIRLGVCS